LLLVPTSVAMLAAALATARRIDLPVTILGGGTNVLVSDRGVRGLIVRLGRAFDYRRWELVDDGSSAVVEVGAATRLRSSSPVVQRAWWHRVRRRNSRIGRRRRANAGAFGGSWRWRLHLGRHARWRGRRSRAFVPRFLVPKVAHETRS
jgi:hypothetical protein